jgi:hypothetical protein
MNRIQALEHQRLGTPPEVVEPTDSNELVADWLQSLSDDRAEVMDACETLFLDPDFARQLCEAALRGDTLTLDSSEWPLSCLADRVSSMYVERAQAWKDDQEAWEL